MIRLIPFDEANLASSCHVSMASSHCFSRISCISGGHGDQIQLTVRACGESPGQPDMVTILSTPSSPASLMEERMTSTCSSPYTGCMGQAEQLIAASLIPRELIAEAKLARLPGSSRSSCRRICGAGDCPPAAISIRGDPKARGKIEHLIKGKVREPSPYSDTSPRSFLLSGGLGVGPKSVDNPRLNVKHLLRSDIVDTRRTKEFRIASR